MPILTVVKGLVGNSTSYVIPIAAKATGIIGSKVIVPAANLAVSTMVSEKKFMSLSEIGLFYVGVAKTCQTATGNKKISCVVAAVACVGAVVPGPQQTTFLMACGAASQQANKL
jgi:hypothetical protein